MSIPKGTLIPIGGNEDKGKGESELHNLDFIHEGILHHVVSQSGGKDSTYVIIPTASSIPVEVGENYLSAFGKLGCTNITVVDIRSKEDAHKKEHIELIKQADCVMFSGGDQSKITDKIGGTIIHQIIAERYKTESKFVIAGTSAGAMAMSEEMIAGGNTTESFQKGAVTMYHGLGLLPRVIIDTHFIKRGRFGRISEAVARFPHLLGIGLAEDTGLIIKEGNIMQVIGSGMVIVFDGSSITHNNYEVLSQSTPITLTDLTVHVLANADTFLLKERQVKVLDLHASFM